MCTDETTTYESPDDSTQGTYEAPDDGAASGRPGWSRRTFLKAAALGTAAAAFLHKGEGSGLGGLSFGPMSALANDLSELPCTAEDVSIEGQGLILNEPCVCSGTNTFVANVQFTVRNHTSTGRYCIALHLVSTTVGGISIPAQDVVLRDANGSSTALGKSGGARFKDTIMFGQISGVPCNAPQEICFGQAGVIRGKCAANTCTTISWNTSPNAAGCSTADQTPPGGQCRHQQVCIRGYGAELECVDGCTPNCGGQATLRATVFGGNPGYRYTLTGSDGSSQSYPSTPGAKTTETSHDFVVTVTQNTTYTLQVCDSSTEQVGGCCRGDEVTLNAQPLSLAQPTATPPGCAGGATIITAVATGGGTITYTFKEGSTTLGSNTTGTLSHVFGSGSHTVTVTASNGPCSDNKDVTFDVPTAVAIAAASGMPPTCAGGNSTLTASASGGTGTITLEFFEGQTSLGTGSPLLYPLSPGLHNLRCVATDQNGCSDEEPFSVTVPQPVTHTLELSGQGNCNGQLTFSSIANGGTNSFTFTWRIDGNLAPNSAVNTVGNTSSLSYGPVLDGLCHTVSCQVADTGPCPSTSGPGGSDTLTKSISQCVDTTVCS